MDFEDDHFHDQCGVFGIYGARRGGEPCTTSGSTRCSTAGKRAAGIVTQRRRAALRAPRHGPRAGRVQRATHREAARATAPSATSATPRPAARTSRTPSPSRSTTRTARSRSPTTATSPTPTSCASGLEARGLDLLIDELDTEVIVHLIARSQAARHRATASPTRCAQVEGRLLARLPHRATADRRARSRGASGRSCLGRLEGRLRARLRADARST